MKLKLFTNNYWGWDFSMASGVNMLDCNIVVSKFKFLSHYCVRFWEGYEPPLISPSLGMGWILLIGLVGEYSPMARETGIQSQVESYQRLKKWYFIPPCLTLSNIRYISRVKWSNPGKGVAPSPYTLVK